MTLANNSITLARNIRVEVLKMVHKANASHVGTCFSIADILAVAYQVILRVLPSDPQSPDRDRMVISKGHSAAAVYATLAHCGFFPTETLASYSANGSMLAGHVSHLVPGVEVSTGSLGHGLPVAGGLALGLRLSRSPARVFALLSDGECNEGSVWEAAMFAGQHGLDNLTVLLDYNKLQGFGRVAEVIDMEPFVDKWRAFGWSVQEVDGHDHTALEAQMRALPFQPGRPSVLICHTIKGKGVSFMEDRLDWHYRSPNDEQLALALAELEAQA